MMGSDGPSHDRLIQELVRELRPVRPLPPPWLRALLWIALVAAAGIVMAGLDDPGALQRRIAAVPAVGWAMLGSIATAILAAIAAFATSVPGRSPRWAWLPLPGLLLWLGSSGWGCLGALGGTGEPAATLGDALTECLPFLLLVSPPLSAALLVMLRRGFPPAPGRTAALAGLAAAAGAATLLNFGHPFDVAAIDLLVHGFVVGVIIAIVRLLGRNWLSRG